MYITHLRSEGNALFEALDEFLTIVRTAGVRGEIYHLKVAGRANWHKLDAVIERIEAEQRDGLELTADMYTYTAGATGLDGAMPPWVQAGGFEAWRRRLTRSRRACTCRRRDGCGNGRMGEHVRARRPGEHPPARVQERGAASADREDACRRRRRARNDSRRNRHGSRRRGSHACRVRVLHDVGGQPAARARVTVGELLLGLGRRRRRRAAFCNGARTRVRTGALPGCLGSTCATNAWSRSRRPSVG